MTRTLHAVASLDERMGGSVRAALDTCRELERRAEQVLVVATTARDDSHGYLRDEYPSVAFQLFPRQAPRHNFRSPALRRWLRKHVSEFDVVELHGVFSFVPLYAAWACCRVGTPYTVRPHGSLDPFDLRKHTLLKRLYGRLLLRPLLDHASVVLLTSELESDRLETYGSVPEKMVIPLPVDPPPSAGDGSEFRKDKGIPADATVVLFLGRIDHKKGLQFLIPALAALKSEYPSLWFLLVGEGEETADDAVSSALARYDIGAWTTRCGFLSGFSKLSAFAASDIFALPSLNENLGIAMIEAMHAGLAVVISDQVYVHDVLAERNAALVCEPSSQSCAAATRRLLADRTLREEMGQRAQAEAETLFGSDATIPQLVELYRKLRRP